MQPLCYFFILITVALSPNACSKKGGTIIPGLPRSEVPDTLTGNWLSGTETNSNEEWMIIRFSIHSNKAGTYFQSTAWQGCTVLTRR